MTELNVLNKKIDYVIRQNNALIDMLGSLVKAFAEQNDIALEDCEEECEYV